MIQMVAKIIIDIVLTIIVLMVYAMILEVMVMGIIWYLKAMKAGLQKIKEMINE